ncbi:MAG: hypothetical protein RLZZ28_378 [Bacteroidota bacterium]|jgi:hypothetical protein
MKKILLPALLSIPFALFAQTATDIVLMDIEITNAKVSLSNPVNITNHKGYDNQPFFVPGKQMLYFTSDRDTAAAHTDIRQYNYQTGEARFLTNTPDKEFSPTLTPDGKYISCIIQRANGTQDLAKYPVNGGDAIGLINHLKVGYHAWIDNNRLLLFILDDSAHNSLHIYNLNTREDKIIAQNPGRSLAKIPGQNAMSFIDKTNPKMGVIKKISLENMQVSAIGNALPGQEYMVWTKNEWILMSDGKMIYYWDQNPANNWQKIEADYQNPLLKGITRLALNAENTKLAIVVRE